MLSGKIAGIKQVNTLKLYQFALMVMGVATTLIPVQKSYFGLVGYVVVFGICESCFIVMIPLITKDIVGVQRLPLALGCVFMLMGITTTVGAPIAGENPNSVYLYTLFTSPQTHVLSLKDSSVLLKECVERCCHQRAQSTS